MRYHALLGLAFLILALWSTFPASAQNVISNEQLLANAQRAGISGRWVDAYGFLYAYIQRAAPELSDPGFKREIEQAVEAAYWNANNASSGGGQPLPAGVAGKGDVVGGGGGKAKSFKVPSKPRRPRSYRLRCEGGGMMNAKYRTAGETAILQVTFQRATRAATKSYPGPGHCAWLDRPLRQGEPARFAWHFSTRDNRITSIAFGARDWAAAEGLSSPKGRMSTIVSGIAGKGLRTLVSKIRNGGIFDVECYNNRKGWLVVTRVF